MPERPNYWHAQHVLTTRGAGLIGPDLAQRPLAEGATQVRAVNNLGRGWRAYLARCLGQPRFVFQPGHLRHLAVARAAYWEARAALRASREHVDQYIDARLQAGEVSA